MPRRSGRPTDYSWDNIGAVDLTQDLAANAQFGTDATTFLSACTLTRTRGKVGVVLDAVVTDESAIILVGLCLVKSDHLAAGNAPEIFTGASDDVRWIWQGALFVSSLAQTGASTQYLADRIDVDSKAMSKIKAGDSLAFVHHAPAELANDQTGTYDISYYLHLLLGS